MKKQITKYLFVLLVIMLHTNSAFTQKFYDGINIGVKAGTSKLEKEMESVFSGTVNEFTHSYGLAYDIEVSKYFGNHWEIGIEGGVTLLRGSTDSPQFSAEGYHHSMPEPITDPVEYENNLLSQKIFGSYYFRNLGGAQSGITINPFLRAGIGNLIYRVKVQYIDSPDDEVIFSKGIRKYNNFNLTTAVFVFGGGLKIKLIDRISLMALANFNYVNYDFLDAVYNYTPTGERSFLKAIYSEYKIGVSYGFGEYAGSGIKKSGKKGKVTNAHQPFAPRR